MNFSTEKKYMTHDGMKARFVTSTLVDGEVFNIFVIRWPAGGEFITSVNSEGVYGDGYIKEVSPWADFKIDDKVEVKFSEKSIWVRGHFAGVDGSGFPMTYNNGKTSWSSYGEVNVWSDCRKVEE